MSFVGRYWEWKRRRALRAYLHAQERARELELVTKVVMERRGVTGPSPDREQAPPSDRSSAVSEDPDSLIHLHMTVTLALPSFW